MIIGICRGSATGKSFTKKILEEVDPSYIVHMEHYLYYKNKDDIPPELMKIRNFDHPDSLEHIQRLKSNKTIEQPIYDIKDL